ncbi:MAG: hypothetical protein QM535_17445, partial [Limnohabitans sp.]|nr:hypothetical protein [Limnohabitans sp.]
CLKHGDAVIATLHDDRQVILPSRFSGLFGDDLIDLINNQSIFMSFSYGGLISEKGRSFHKVTFYDEENTSEGAKIREELRNKRKECEDKNDESEDDVKELKVTPSTSFKEPQIQKGKRTSVKKMKEE